MDNFIAIELIKHKRDLIVINCDGMIIDKQKIDNPTHFDRFLSIDDASIDRIHRFEDGECCVL